MFFNPQNKLYFHKILNYFVYNMQRLKAIRRFAVVFNFFFFFFFFFNETRDDIHISYIILSMPVVHKC